MVALVAEDAERHESRTPVRVDEEQEVQTVLPVDLEADRIRHVDDSLDQVARAARLEVLAQVSEIEHGVRRREAVRGWFADRAQVVAHGVDQLPEFIDDFRLGMMLTEEIVKHILAALRHIFEGQAELLRVADHRLVPSVDEFAATLGHLTGEIDRTRECAAQREAPAAGPIARLVDRRVSPELVPARKPRKARADDRHVARRRPGRRKRPAEWAGNRADRS
jgi:hypothetical protein